MKGIGFMKSQFKLAATILLCAITLHCLAWSTQAAVRASMGYPLKTVLSDYQKIQQALAKDSMQGVAEHARAIAKAVHEDQGKTLSLSVAEKADKLAQATDLKDARAAFKPLSRTLIDYLAENKVKSTGFKEVYCPMAKAAWLQTGQQVLNPYMGKEMPTCGEVQRSF